MEKSNTSYFRVIADPDLPKAERRRAAEKNPLVKEVFQTHEAARMALFYSEVPTRKYKIAECISVGNIWN